MKKLSVHHCASARPGPKLGSPTVPGNLPAHFNRLSGRHRALTRHPGNTPRQTLRFQPSNAATYSGRASNINPAPRQRIWHTLSHMNPAPWQHTRHTLSHSHINPAQWQHFPAHAQTLTRHGTHFPQIPGTTPAPFLTQHGNNTYYTTKMGLKCE